MQLFCTKCITNTHKIVSITLTSTPHVPAKGVTITKPFTSMGNFVENRLELCKNAVVWTKFAKSTFSLHARKKSIILNEWRHRLNQLKTTTDCNSSAMIPASLRGLYLKIKSWRGHADGNPKQVEIVMWLFSAKRLFWALGHIFTQEWLSSRLIIPLWRNTPEPLESEQKPNSFMLRPKKD